MRLNRPIMLSKKFLKRVSIPQMVIAIAAQILFGGEYCFPQSHNTGQTMKTDIKLEERIATLEKRITEAGDDYVSLTAEEYDLLLSQPLGSIEGFKPLTTTAGGIMLGIGYPEDSDVYKTDLQIVFPNIPNISEGTVFVYFDYVKGTNGLDYLDRQGNTEIKDDGTYADDDFTQLTLDEQTGESKPYWFGSRYVNLRDPEDNMTIRALGALGGGVKLSAVSGKVVMILPTNITSLTLTKDDIGIEKPFSGGVITLIEINDDNLSFHFYNKGNKNLFAWIFFDDYQNQLDIEDVNENNGLYHLSVAHAQTVNLYEADIIRKEFPFSFEIEGQSVSEQTSEQVVETENTQPDIQAPVYLDTKDPIFLNIHSRAISDLDTIVKGFNPESEHNKLIDIQTQTWTEEMRSECQALGAESINDYAEQTHLSVGTFMMIITSLGEIDHKKMEKEWEVRVQFTDGNKYIAEFWEDGLAVNSEENAIAYANELAVSEYAKRHPDSDVGNVEVIKKNYKDVRNSIQAGKKEQYQKMMALLYNVDEGGMVSFINPFQPSIDFLNKNRK